MEHPSTDYENLGGRGIVKIKLGMSIVAEKV